MGEKMTTALPQGWTIDEDEPEDELPPGWKVESTPSTANERDEAKLKKEAGVFAAPEVTREQLKNMSVSEKLQYAEELKREREYLQSSQFVKGALSGLTFGASENINALKREKYEEFTPYSLIGSGGEITGSLVPLTGLMKVIGGAAVKLASKSPVLQKQLSSLLTMFGVGATDKAFHQLAKGEVPSADDMLEHGVEWVTLDVLLQSAGAAGRFAKGLLSRSKETGIPRLELLNQLNRELAESGVDMTNAEAVSAKALEILERPITEAEVAAGKRLQLAEKEASKVSEVAEQALKPEEIKPIDLKTRKITDEPINRLTKESVVLSEPYQPERIDFTKEAEVLEQDAIQSQIDSVGTRAVSEEELGASIREDIEAQLEAQKAEYRPFYQEAEEAATHMHHVPQNTAREAGNRLQRISRLKTRPEGYPGVIKNLETILEDAGFVIQRDENGAIELIVSNREVPVSDTIELARRLNEIIDYEAVEPTVKDALRGVARAAKQDVRLGLAANPDALAAFELAEGAHAATAQKFSKNNIRKIRSQQAGEKVSKMAEAPSALGDLREVLSPQQMLQVERELLEKLNNQTYEKSKKQLKEIERHLSEENKRLAREIVESKNPHNPGARKKLTQDSILNDMSNAFTNGTRPTKTLELWKSPKGQKLVKQTFYNSPNWPQVKNYLEKQSFNDMVASVTKDGKIDLKKLKAFINNPATVNNIRAQGGEEAVTFFRDLNGYVKQLEQNSRLLEKLPSKEQIEKGRKFIKESPGQKRLEEGIAKNKRVERETTKIGQEELKIGEKAEKSHEEARRRRGDEILQRMTRKDYPMQSRVNDWKLWIKDMLGLNAQAAMNVFGMAKLGGATIGAWTFGIPSTVITMIGFKMMNKLMTSQRARKALKEASKYQFNPLKFIISLEEFGKSLDED